MSKSIIEIRRKRDGKLLRDEINDACQTHNIYDGNVLVESNKDYNIGYLEGEGFCDDSEYELVDNKESVGTKACADMTEQERQILLKALCGFLPYGVKYKANILGRENYIETMVAISDRKSKKTWT